MEHGLTKTGKHRWLLAGLAVPMALAGSTGRAAPTADDGIRHFEGAAFATADGHLMYRESHWLYRDRGTPAQLVLYRCPDGRPFARKQVRDIGSAQAPNFELDDGRSGYREGVRGVGETREVFVRANRSAKTRSAPLADSPELVVDGGFDAYVREHWDSLARDGGTIRFVIPSRLKALSFKVTRQPDSSVDGRVVRMFRLSLDSWIGFALPHIDVAYDARTRQLLRFRGLSNIRSEHGDNVRAEIRFEPGAPAQGSAAALAAARSQPLDGRCPL
jgi:hypothetical protein